MKFYNALYKQILNEYQNTVQNPKIIALQNYFKQLGQQVEPEVISGILAALEDKNEQPTQDEAEEEKNNTDVPEEKPTTSNISPVMNNPLNPFNKNQQKVV